MTNDPAATIRVSPMPIVRAVWSVPYQSMSDEPTGEPSHSWRPIIDPTDENGPNVIAAVFDADIAGEFAAPNSAVMREYPVNVPISDPLIDVGVPAARPAHSAFGRGGFPAPCKHQSRYALLRSSCYLRGLFIPRFPPVARRFGLSHLLLHSRRAGRSWADYRWGSLPSL